MIVQKRGEVSIYNLTSGPSLPEWISERARRNLSKKDEDIRRRVELIQDFGMPASSTKLRQSPDGRYFLAAGTYPPRIRCFDTNELGLKFERYVTAGVVDLCMLSEDYGKFCLLQEDRTLAFHAPYGAHESVRIPTFGRAIAYESSTCDLLVAAKGSSVYRMNLEEGRFQVPWELDMSHTNGQEVSSTCLAVHPAHPLAAVGCDDGILRFWDSRVADQFKPLLRLDVSSAIASTPSYATTHSNEITAIAFDSATTNKGSSNATNGLSLAVGTATGMVALYDIRSSRPLLVYAHKAGQPIHTLHFHHHGRLLLSADETLIQATRTTTTSSSSSMSRRNGIPTNSVSGGTASETTTTMGSTLFHIEATSHFHHFIVSDQDSGLIMCATDQPKMEAFYVPSLGVAPKWCSFLENITEELQERDLTRNGVAVAATGGGGDPSLSTTEETVFENYKFVSREDVEKLGLAHLIGTPLLRGYMHGFFMDQTLYHRVKAIADPFEYEEYQKKKLAERVQAKRASRIAPRDAKNNKKKNAATTTVAVNPELAERLQAAQASSGSGTKKKKKKDSGADLLQDDRFGSLFTNPDFEIDQQDENFKLRNPSGVALARRIKDNMDSDEDDFDDDDESELSATAKAKTHSKRTGIQARRGEQEENPSDEDHDDEDDDDDTGALDDDESDDDSDHIGFKDAKVRGEEYENVKAALKPKKTKKKNHNQPRTKKSGVKRVKMHEAEEDAVGNNAVRLGLGNQEASQRARRRLDEMNLPLAKRISQQQQQQGDERQHPTLQVRVQEGGSKEATYIPRDARKKKGEETRRQEVGGGGGDSNDQSGRRNRRGIRELGLKRFR